MKRVLVAFCLLIHITTFCADTKKKPVQRAQELRYGRYHSTCPAAQPATHKRHKNTANKSLIQTPPQQNPNKLSLHSSSTSVNSSWTKDDDSE